MYLIGTVAHSVFFSEFVLVFKELILGVVKQHNYTIV